MFGEDLRFFRETSSQPIWAIAEAAGVWPSTIASWEAGATIPRLAKREKISQQLGEFFGTDSAIFLTAMNNDSYKQLDLTNRRFEKLTVLQVSSDRIRGNTSWVCQCNCPEQTVITTTSANLIHKLAKSCGCLQKVAAQRTGLKNLKDLVGKKVGQLVVIERYSPLGERPVLWKTKCRCGRFRIVDGKRINAQNVSSCWMCSH
jgi:transcriptional regulator with XRE-family HTH domain